MKRTDYFRPNAILACLSILILQAGLAARCGYSRDPSPREASEAVLSPDEERVIAALPMVPPDLNLMYALKTEAAKRVSILYTCKVHEPRFTATNWIFVAPIPPDLPSQKVSHVTMRPAGTAIADLSPLRRPLLRAEAPVRTEAQRHDAAVEVRMDAEIFARRLVTVGGKGDSPMFADARIGTVPRLAVPSLTAAERRLALRPAGLCDYTNSSFRDWVANNRLTRGAKEGEVDFARRVFVFLVKNLRYEYTGDEQDRSLAHVCAVKKSDCGGMSVMFVAAMRSQGIPARVLVGRCATSATHGPHGDSQEHVKAEFFAQGVGWVPVDVAVAVNLDKTAEKLDYFGHDKGDHLAFCVDTDVSFDTRDLGVKRVTWFQSACYYATGAGSFDGEVVEEDWKVFPALR